MSPTGPRGGRTTGAVSPLLLVVGGLLLALVATTLLVLQLQGGGGESPGQAAPPTVAATSTPRPTTASATTPADDPPTRSTSAAPTTTTREEKPSSTKPSRTSEPSARAAAPTRATATASATQQAASGATWISIPAGGVDGPLTPQGLAADGTINPGRGQIIWFTGYDRVAPGQVGTSVIAAHVTWAGAPDAFVNLPSIGVGDVVTVGYGDGSTSTFTVVETMAVDKDALARSTTVWGAHPGVRRLAIITCDPALGYQADGHTAANFVAIAEG